jgi:protein gp37
MCDVFESHPVPDEQRPRLWQLIRKTPMLDWLLLTKRPENIAPNLPSDGGEKGWPNVWLGTSVENQARVDERIPILLKVPAVVHFLSCEPLLEPINVEMYLGPKDVNWLITGGESGPGFRPMDVSWALSLRDQCARAKVAHFFKQSAAPRTEMGIELDGKIDRHFP